MLYRAIGFLSLIAMIALAACQRRGGGPEPEPAKRGVVWFEDVAPQAGIHFRHFDPATELHMITETIGSGLGWIDYDADGWPDLFCVQDGPIPPKTDPSQTHKLYRNNRNGAFTDVTDAVGLNESGFGLGCAVGDYDNDGFDDLVVTALGGIALYHNEPDAAAPGGRRFRNVTTASGLANSHYGTSCAWGDLDGDGLLDLYVCNYVEIDPARPITCRHPEQRYYFPCTPSAYAFTSHLLFRNLGNGRFQDISEASGIASSSRGPGLGVLIADLDADGKPDIYVVNDMSEAFLFHNLGGMKFEERGLRSGVALGPGGLRMAGMGIAVGDFDGSGRPSLFVTDFQSVPNAFFLNRGKLNFDESSYRAGLAGPSLSKLRFGTWAFDANLDGHLDLITTSGHVHRLAQEHYGLPYAQQCQLFMGNGAAQFHEVSSEAGADFLKPRVGRGLAVSDFDNDGLPDVAISGVGEAATLLRNRSATKNNWISMELAGDGKKSNRNAVGAVVEVHYSGKKQHYFVVGGGSYLSAPDRRVHLGLGEASQLDRLSIRWPSGRVQEVNSLPGRTRWKIIEGQAPQRVEP
jgi:hypothetical protein